MADPTATVVPFEDPDQSEVILKNDFVNPLDLLWWGGEDVSGVPENVMGWLVAQGWKITAVLPDLTTNPPTRTYTMQKNAFSSEQVLISLCQSFTTQANDAKFANEARYQEIVRDWTQMIASSQVQFNNQVTAQNTDLGVYITDLTTYMDDIDTLSEANADTLATDYAAHKTLSQGLLTGLGTTEESRINELFASTLADQLQLLTDQGMYNSIRAQDLTERNARNKDEELQKHRDSLAREKNSNEHVLWNEKLQLAAQNNTAITQKMETSVRRLDGWKSVAADNQRLMAYQLDQRNQLLTGLYSFVERRDDVAPAWKDMSQMIAGLGDSGGGWITP